MNTRQKFNLEYNKAFLEHNGFPSSKPLKTFGKALLCLAGILGLAWIVLVVMVAAGRATGCGKFAGDGAIILIWLVFGGLYAFISEKCVDRVRYNILDSSNNIFGTSFKPACREMAAAVAFIAASRALVAANLIGWVVTSTIMTVQNPFYYFMRVFFAPTAAVVAYLPVFYISYYTYSPLGIGSLVKLITEIGIYPGVFGLLVDTPGSLAGGIFQIEHKYGVKVHPAAVIVSEPFMAGMANNIRHYVDDYILIIANTEGSPNPIGISITDEFCDMVEYRFRAFESPKKAFRSIGQVEVLKDPDEAIALAIAIGARYNIPVINIGGLSKRSRRFAIDHCDKIIAVVTGHPRNADSKLYMGECKDGCVVSYPIPTSSIIFGTRRHYTFREVIRLDNDAKKKNIESEDGGNDCE